MKFILIENNDPGYGVTVTVCDTVEERNRKTLEAIYGAPLKLTPDMEGCALAALAELKENGELHFEGDPGLQWLDACEVKCPNDQSSGRRRMKAHDCKLDVPAWCCHKFSVC